MTNSRLGSVENPVKCKGIDGEYEYLDRLVGPSGIPISYTRVGSMPGDEEVILDIYEITYDGLTEPIVIHINMYAKGPKEKRAVPGLFLETDFIKSKYWQKLGYMDEVIAKELDGKRPALPSKYVYIYTKSATLLSYGPHIYARRDFFSYPLAEWDFQGLMHCAEQIVHYLRGISADRPIQISSAETARQFLELMHFDQLTEHDTEDKTLGLLCLHTKHMMMDEESKLFFDTRGVKKINQKQIHQ